MSGKLKPVPGLVFAYEQADALAGLLESKGFATTVYNKGGHADHPCIQVEAARWDLIGRVEWVYLAPVDDGQWWFWDSFLEPIAAAKEVSVAADKVARSLAGITWSAIRVL